MNCGERQTLTTLYEKTGRAALSKTMHLVGLRSVAEEIVQETFLKLWQSSLTFTDERAAYAWIYRTCHNAGIDFLRSAAARSRTGDQGPDPDELTGDDPWTERIADRQRLMRALGRLSDREAQVLAYKVIDGMTGDEIAEVMGLSRKTVVRTLAALTGAITGGGADS